MADDVQKKPVVKKSLGPTQMRAPSTMERVGQGMRDVLGSVAEQPLARIADALGITGLNQLSQADPRNNEMQRGEMVGDPRGILRNFSRPGSIAPMRQGLPAEFNQTLPAGGSSMRQAPTPDYPYIQGRSIIDEFREKGIDSVHQKAGARRNIQPIDMNMYPDGGDRKLELLTDFPSNVSGEAYALEEAMLRKQRQGLK